MALQPIDLVHESASTGTLFFSMLVFVHAYMFEACCMLEEPLLVID